MQAERPGGVQLHAADMVERGHIEPAGGCHEAEDEDHDRGGQGAEAESAENHVVQPHEEDEDRDVVDEGADSVGRNRNTLAFRLAEHAERDAEDGSEEDGRYGDDERGLEPAEDLAHVVVFPERTAQAERLVLQEELDLRDQGHADTFGFRLVRHDGDESAVVDRLGENHLSRRSKPGRDVGGSEVDPAFYDRLFKFVVVQPDEFHPVAHGGRCALRGLQFVSGELFVAKEGEWFASDQDAHAEHAVGCILFSLRKLGLRIRRRDPFVLDGLQRAIFLHGPDLPRKRFAQGAFSGGE